MRRLSSVRHDEDPSLRSDAASETNLDMDTEGLRTVWFQDESTLAEIGAALAA